MIVNEISRVLSKFGRIIETVNKGTRLLEIVSKGARPLNPNNYRLVMALLTLILVVIAIAQLAR